MATWGNSNNYPGTNTPAWWYASTTATTTTTWPQQVTYVAQVASPPKRERTAIEWLRDRVQEMCDLAELAA